jgi:hypothetical protein
MLWDRDEQVLTATWTEQHGVDLVSSDLPDAWADALHRLGRDLHVRQYGGSIERIDWVAEYDADGGYVFLLSGVTVAGRVPHGLGISGAGAQIDDTEEDILTCIADVVQDQVARAHVAWPWGDSGGFMKPHLVDGTAVWDDKGRQTPIGTL